MPAYFPTALHIFQHKPPDCAQYAPYPWNKTIHGKQIWLSTQKRSPPHLNPAYTNCVQSINGKNMYYALAVDSTILPAINNIFTCQSTPTQDTLAKCNQVLDYASMHPNATIIYHVSNMILMEGTDIAYLVLPAAHSHIACHFLLQNICLIILMVPNGPILT